MSDYYYGQGKLYLARRNAACQALSWRWVGDVSALNIELELEEKKKLSSVGGVLVPSQRFITSVSGKITSTWNDFSSENLEILLGANRKQHSPDVYAQETLPAGIEAGDRVTLDKQNIWGVYIKGMNAGSDFIVDNTWGAITFLTTPQSQPISVDYQHPGNTSLPMIQNLTRELSLRYEGINLAENNRHIVAEFYRVSFDLVTKLALINTESELSNLETTSNILYDITKGDDAVFGRFGRLVMFDKLSGITHDGRIRHNGRYSYRG